MDYSFRSQDFGNYNCGIHALHTIAKFVHLPQAEYINYINALRLNPIESNENRIFNFVKKHFK